MITYLTQLTICWTILFAVYLIFLKRETFFMYNRWFLLAGLVLGLIIPLIDWAALIPHKAESIGHIYVAPVQTQVHQFDVYVATSESTPIWYILLMGLYSTGVLMAGIKLISGIREIWSMRVGADIHQENGYELVLTRQHHMPFSFLNAVYWSRDFYHQSSEKDRILAHEARHVSAWHSLDILFIELLCVAFWFHPMVYVYRKEIKEVHEYEADAAACVLGSKKAYGQLLINQADSGLQLALANHFFYSQLKNRFKMMTRKPSSQTAKFKYLIAIPMIVLAAVVFSFVNKDIIAEQEPITVTDSIPLTNALDINAVSPSELHSDDTQNGESRYPARRPMIAKFKPLKTFMGTKKMEMTYSRDESLDYPIVKKPQETAVIHYTLKKDGSIVKPKIVSTTTERVGKEAMAILDLTKRMRHQDSKDLKDGKEVEMRFGFVEGRWTHLNRTYISKRTYPDQNYLDILEEKVNRIFLLIDEKEIGVIKTKKLSDHIQYDDIYSISNSNKEEDLRKFGMDDDIHIIDIKTKTWADNNPDKINRGFKTIVGKVVDKNGQPIVGANVMIKGTRSGTATDFNGEYRMQGVDKNDVMIYSTPDESINLEIPVNSKDFRNAIIQFPTVHLYQEPASVKEVYKGEVVDALPRFPGCEALSGTDEEKDSCATRKMLEFLYTNIKYPAAARDNAVRGQVWASFVVKKNGSVDYIHIIRDIGAGLGDEVKRLLEEMKSQGRWTPAMKDGKPINFKMTLPVTFELKGENIRSDVKKIPLDNAVNPLSEIVVVGFSNASVRPSKQFDINEAIQDAIKEGKMDSQQGIKVVGFGEKSENKESKGTQSGITITGHPQKSGPISINDLPPLIVLDGHIIGRADGTINLGSVYSDNIESVTVLSDESAVQKYGEKASTGVIIITSKEPVLKSADATLKLNNFNLYPNPASNELTIHFESVPGEYRLEVLNAKGATQIMEDLYSRGHTRKTIDISDLNSGVYYLKISSGSKVTAKVFVKN